ncbi:MAG: DNA repair protein RadC [Chthoniobacteraceae bacterium]
MGSLRIQELREDERPREKLALHGAATLSEPELIAILLRVGTQGANAIDVARQLLAEFKSLAGLARASVKELGRIKGVGPAKAVQLAAAFELASRLARADTARVPVETPEQVWALLGAEMSMLTRESLRVILLDTKLKLLRTEEVSLGSLNESLAHPREVFRPALLYAAFGLIVVHNHPSGDSTPSDADRRLTQRLRSAAELLSIQLIDHIILGNADGGRVPWFSFRQAGML